MTSVEELARDSIEDFNRGDFEAMRAQMAPDIVYEETGTGRRTTGADQVLDALHAWKTAMPDAAGTITRMLVDDDTAVMEIVWRGTHSGSLPTPGGEVPATGRTVEVWGTMWAEWKDGKLVAERHHLDVLSLLAQIGAIPVPA